MSDDWRAKWAIRELKGTPRDGGDQCFWNWSCTLERDATRTVIHAPGLYANAAINTAWELAEMVENAGNG